ncbi:MAG: hypothetical protein IJ876_07550 [Elusimicrobiaceae bacterium]|nr:hypothetical protein [Elusimicrobiaceae bacterium]
MISANAQKELTKLLEGNKNFISGKPTAKNMCLETLQSLALYQEPYACVLSCSDSRVVPEIIFDCGIGELFVVRVAGIAVGPNVKESIEYAVKKLHVPLLILLGHDDCGVMKYASEQYPELPEHFQSILKCVYPVIDKKGKFDCNNEFARKHTLWVEKYLLEHSDIIQKAVQKDQLYIAKCHFNHHTGQVELLS